MNKISRRKSGARTSLVLLSVLLFLLLFAPAASAATYGDINDDGKIDVNDVTLVMQHALGLITLTEAQQNVADVNGDGNINVNDVTLIMQHALGLIAEFPDVALSVAGVTAVNPKQVEVEFSRILRSDEMEDMVLASFHVGLQGTTTVNRLLAGGSAAAVLEDNKTVRLTIGGDRKFANGSTSNRVVVRKEVGLDSDYAVTNLAFTDTAVPTLVDVKSISPRTLVLTFSEPLEDDGTPTNIELQNGVIGLNLHGATYSDPQRQLRIDTFMDLSAGNYTLVIKSGTNLKDYTGNGVVPVSKTFTHSPITTAPSISIKSSNERSVTIEFSREINADTLIDNGRVLFRHTYDSVTNEVNGTDVSNPSGDDKTFVIDFDDKLLPPGDTTMWLKYAANTVDADKIQDTWGNVIAPASFTVTTVADTTPPTATVTVVSNTQIDIQYSESVNGATTLTNYSLKKGSESISLDSITDESGNKYRLTTVNAMQGTYSLTISNIKDKSPAENLMGTKTFTIEVDDEINPLVVNLAGKDAKLFYWQDDSVKTKNVRIFFNEPMNTTDLATKSMYEHAGNNPTVATPAGDGKSVYLEFANVVTGDIKVGALRDLAGNRLYGSLSTDLSGAYYSVELDASITNNARATTPTRVVLYINDIVVNLKLADFEVYNGTIWVTPVSLTNNTSSGKSVITLNLASADAMGYDAASAEVRTVTNPDAENQYGVTLSILDNTPVKDRIPPVVDQVFYIDESTIEVTFKEDLAPSTLTSGRNGFSVAGSTITSAVLDGTDKVVITKSATGANFSVGSVVSYSASFGEIKDVAGNALVSFSKAAEE